MPSQRNTEFHQVLLAELQEIKSELREVRTVDVPALQEKLAIYSERLEFVKADVRKESRRDALVYGGVGSVLSAVMAFVAFWLKH